MWLSLDDMECEKFKIKPIKLKLNIITDELIKDKKKSQNINIWQ